MRPFQWGVRSWLGAVIAASILALVPAAAGRVMYVKWDATGANDGTSWADAHVYLQDALAASVSGDEIWVAAGTYRPGQMPAETFALHNGAGVYGGFAGIETTREQRDPAANLTHLAQGMDEIHIVTATNLDATTVLDGFGISGIAFAGLPSDHRGAAIYMINSSMSVIDCRLSGMALGVESGANCGKGGAVYVSGGAPVFERCAFSGSIHAFPAGGLGGALYGASSSLTFRHCTFSGGRAGDGQSSPGLGVPGGSGGAVALEGASALFEDCAFTSNRAGNGGYGPDRGGSGGSGGAVYGGSNTFIRCTFTGNTAGNGGGTAYYGTGGSGGVGGAINAGGSAIEQCEFRDNHAGHGASGDRAGSGGAGGAVYGQYDVIRDSLFVGNTAGSGAVATGSQEAGQPGGAGGAIRGGALLIERCRFLGNRCGAGVPVDINASAGGDGGGVYSRVNGATIVNSLFVGNEAGKQLIGGLSGIGGGLALTQSSAHVVNCTFAVNATGGPSVPARGGGGVAALSTADALLENCILWLNNASVGDPAAQVFGNAIVRYSDVQGGWMGTGNMNANPMFVDLDGADDVVGTEDDDLHLRPGSPCVDAGSNTVVPSGTTTDLDGLARFVDEVGTIDTGEGTPPIVDIGAYEARDTGFANGDVNCDSAIDFFDIDPFLLALFDPASYPQVYPDCDITLADMNDDSHVDNFDVDPFLAVLFGQ